MKRKLKKMKKRETEEKEDAVKELTRKTMERFHVELGEEKKEVNWNFLNTFSLLEADEVRQKVIGICHDMKVNQFFWIVVLET